MSHVQARDRLILDDGYTSLRRPGEVAKTHALVDARIPQDVPARAQRSPIAERHHEGPDGEVHPHGLRGDGTPLAERIVDVHGADAHDAITSLRADRPGPASDARARRWSGAGTDFDREVVGALTTAQGRPAAR